MLNEIVSLFSTNQPLFILLVGILGLLVGSFLNVVIYRVPQTLIAHWRKDCHKFLEIKDAIPTKNILLSIMFPSSNCPTCHTGIKFYDNIPVLSYLWLRGSCRSCKANISIRYPLVEVLSGLLCMLVAYKFGVSSQTLFGCIFSWVLIVQSFIDLDHTFIPDEITLPALWLGLLLSTIPIFANMHASIFGAVFGYLALWSVYWIFYWLTKKEGMGFGDFKLLAMIGAWLGWQTLPSVIILSSILGSIVGITFILITKQGRNTQIPFGPYLAIAAWIALLWGQQINIWYLEFVGVLI